MTKADATSQEAENNARNMNSLEILLTKHGVKLHRFNKDMLRRISKVSEEVVAGVGAADATTKKIYESYMAYRKQGVAWASIGEGAFLTARAAVIK